MSCLSKATNIIRDYLKQKSVVRFRPYDVLDLLQSLVPGQLQTDSADQVCHSVTSAIFVLKLGGMGSKKRIPKSEYELGWRHHPFFSSH